MLSSHEVYGPLYVCIRKIVVESIASKNTKRRLLQLRSVGNWLVSSGNGLANPVFSQPRGCLRVLQGHDKGTDADKFQVSPRSNSNNSENSLILEGKVKVKVFEVASKLLTTPVNIPLRPLDVIVEKFRMRISKECDCLREESWIASFSLLHLLESGELGERSYLGDDGEQTE